MMLLLSSLWVKFSIISLYSIWLIFTSHRALQWCHQSHTTKSAKIFWQCKKIFIYLVQYIQSQFSGESGYRGVDDILQSPYPVYPVTVFRRIQISGCGWYITTSISSISSHSFQENPDIGVWMIYYTTSISIAGRK